MGMVRQTDLRAAVRGLHRPIHPDDTDYEIKCAECSAWPCDTAKLVYTAGEIEAERATLTARREAEDREIEAWRAANPNPGPEPTVDGLLPRIRISRDAIRYEPGTDR